MRPCIKCGQYRDTIHGVCGNCRGKKTVRDRRKRAIAILGVVIIASIGGIYGYQTFLESELESQIEEKATETLNQAKDFVEENYVKIPQVVGNVKIPEISLPTIEPTPTLTLEELKQIALDDINKYRQEKGLRAISLGSARSPQLYSEELLQEGCIHHVSNSGQGPMLRYKTNGDKMFLVAENIAGGNGLWYMTPEKSILDGNWRMMFEDADSNWGHRDNILTTGHKSVSIGIAYDRERLVMVQDFEQSLQPGYQYHPSSFQKEPVDQKFCW